MRSTGAEKRRLTIILACTAAGNMLPPMIMFKGKRALKNLRIPPGVVVELQQKGWNDASLTLVWIHKVLLRYTKRQHALLVWDTFTGHMTEQVAEKLRNNNVTVAVIPGGCTGKIQPFDVCLNKPFKCYCRSQWIEYMQKQVATQDPGARPKTASKQHLGSKREMVAKSFLVCGISNALDGSQNNMIRCAKELPVMMIAYGLEKNAAADGGSESDDPFSSDEENDSDLDQSEGDSEPE